MTFKVETEDDRTFESERLTMIKPIIKGGNKKYPAFMVVIPRPWIECNMIKIGDFIQLELSKKEIIIKPHRILIKNSSGDIDRNKLKNIQ